MLNMEVIKLENSQIKLYIGKEMLSLYYTDWYIEGDISEDEEFAKIEEGLRIVWELYYVKREDVPRILELYNAIGDRPTNQELKFEFKNLTQSND
jgi:hypothetical protein